MDDPLARIGTEPVGQLATVGPGGQPHMVPVVFAVVDGQIVTAIDWKPKTDRRLQRLTNIESDPRVGFLVHSYSDDWDDLWWVRIDGVASLHDGDSTWKGAIDALVAKYHQYRSRPPSGTVIAIVPERISSWESGA